MFEVGSTTKLVAVKAPRTRGQIVVLSGIGAKEYYRPEFGYSSQGDYMVKNL